MWHTFFVSNHFALTFSATFFHVVVFVISYFVSFIKCKLKKSSFFSVNFPLFIENIDLIDYLIKYF